MMATLLMAMRFHVELYNYDYAGALWLENDSFANGNYGVFMEVKKRLCEIIATDPMIKAVHPEDVLCRNLSSLS